MRMEQYLTHTDYALWEVIVNDDAPGIALAGTEGPIPPKTAEQKLARKNELKAKSTLLLAIPNEHLLKFHGIKNAKTLWEANHDHEDANLKLLRSLPSAWNNIALIMRNKADLDTLKNTSSTNEAVNTAHDVNTASSQGQASTSTYADDVMFSFFTTQSNSPQLDNEDLEQIDTDDLEEMDLKWRGYFARESRAPRNQGNRNGYNPRRVVPVENSTNALVVADGMGYDWSYQAEKGPTDFALMAYSSSSSSSSSDTEVSICSKACLKSYESLKEHFDK
ncbi:hypothetical protein Tco_1186642 [Tanacetum coccineum]